MKKLFVRKKYLDDYNLAMLLIYLKFKKLPMNDRVIFIRFLLNLNLTKYFLIHFNLP
jgi:hypothetical protein